MTSLVPRLTSEETSTSEQVSRTNSLENMVFLQIFHFAVNMGRFGHKTLRTFLKSNFRIQAHFYNSPNEPPCLARQWKNLYALVWLSSGLWMKERGISCMALSVE